MPRLSFEITDQQYQALKVAAALKGQSIEDYVLERAFADISEVSNMSEDDAG